jgi:hypothetical protein
MRITAKAHTREVKISRILIASKSCGDMTTGIGTFVKSKVAEVIARVYAPIPGSIEAIFFKEPVVKGTACLPYVINIDTRVK